MQDTQNLTTLGRIIALASGLEAAIESADENEVDSVDRKAIEILAEAVTKFTTYMQG